MKLSEMQSDFLWMVNSMLNMIKPELSNNVLLKIVEWNRTIETQRKYAEDGKSATLKSKHLRGLAVDFAVIINRVYVEDSQILHRMGNWWIAHGGVWGGEWKDPYDPYHFEYNSIRRMGWRKDYGN